MQTIETMVFTEEAFWKTFMLDLEKAKARVLIQSPFLAARRIRFMSRTLTKLISRGVTVCAIVQQPRMWQEGRNSPDQALLFQRQELQSNLDSLRAMGIHVTLRPAIHEKLAVIDESIFWEGSLNILSHANTRERMRRWTNKLEIRRAIVQHCMTDCAVCTENFIRYGIMNGSHSAPFGSMLGHYRTSLGLSQRELSRRCGLSHGRIAQIEAGTNITLASFVRLAAALELVPILVPAVLAASVGRLLQTFSTSD